jgi:hypothetical protein
VTFGSGAIAERFTVQEKDLDIVTLPLQFTYAGWRGGPSADEHGSGELRVPATSRVGRRSELHAAVRPDGTVQHAAAGR